MYLSLMPDSCYLLPTAWSMYSEPEFRIQEMKEESHNVDFSTPLEIKDKNQGGSTTISKTSSWRPT